MRKQELIHLHGLLAEVCTYCDRDESVPDVDVDRYRSVGVHPASIHRSKGDHQEAVFALAEDITASLDTRARARADDDADGESVESAPAGAD